jgi:dCMP deaminase
MPLHKPEDVEQLSLPFQQPSWPHLAKPAPFPPSWHTAVEALRLAPKPLDSDAADTGRVPVRRPPIEYVGRIRPSVAAWALDMAEQVAKRSRDPSTQVGCVILRPDNSVVSVGYNGFPRGCNDDPAIYQDRPRKYRRTIHAEVNAVLTGGFECRGATAYVSPLHPCPQCAGVMIQAGISKIVYRQPAPRADWHADFDEAAGMLFEAGVALWSEDEYRAARSIAKP